MSISDFNSLTPLEFAEVYKCHSIAKETSFKQEWEQTRWLAACLLSPHSKKPLRPTDLCRFSWEQKAKSKDLSKKQKKITRSRLGELEKKWE